MTTYKSDTKPRYDNGGSEFGNMHRTLPKTFGMFDFDRMKATAKVPLELVRQNIAFLEYKTIFRDGEINFTALFEIKHKDSPFVRDAMKCKCGTATWAQVKTAEKLGCRYFFVIATNGKQPFSFYEITYEFNVIEWGVLEYDDLSRDATVLSFWNKIGLK